MTADSPETRRTTPRKPLRARAQLAAPGKSMQSGMTVDVSVSGVSLMLAEQVASDVVCSIRFEMPIAGITHIVQATAVVVYSDCVGQKGFRVGFRFNKADPERAKLIGSL